MHGDRRTLLESTEPRGPRRQVHLAERLVIKGARLHPRIQLEPPQRLAFVDVADARRHALVEQQLPQRLPLGLPRPLENFIQVELCREDVRAKGPEVVLEHLFSLQLRDGSIEENRHAVLVLQHDLREVGRPAPRFAGPIDLPRTAHPHVAVHHQAALDMNEDILAAQPGRSGRLTRGVAGLAPRAAHERSVAGWLVRSLGLGRRRCVAVVLGSRPCPDRRVLPPAEPRAARLAEGRRVVAQPPDPARRSDAAPPRPGSLALGPQETSPESSTSSVSISRSSSLAEYLSRTSAPSVSESPSSSSESTSTSSPACPDSATSWSYARVASSSVGYSQNSVPGGTSAPSVSSVPCWKT